MRKLRPPKVKGVENSKEQIIEQYKGWFPNTQKKIIVCYCGSIEVQK